MKKSKSVLVVSAMVVIPSFVASGTVGELKGEKPQIECNMAVKKNVCSKLNKIEPSLFKRILYYVILNFFRRKSATNRYIIAKAFVSAKFSTNNNWFFSKKKDGTLEDDSKMKVDGYEFPIKMLMTFNKEELDYEVVVKIFGDRYTIRLRDDLERMEKEISAKSVDIVERIKWCRSCCERLRNFIDKNFCLTGCYWSHKDGYWMFSKKVNGTFSMTSKVRICGYDFPIDMTAACGEGGLDREIVIGVFGKKYIIKSDNDVEKIKDEVLNKCKTVDRDISQMKKINERYGFKFFQCKNSQDFKIVLPKNLRFDFNKKIVNEIYYDVKTSKFSLHCMADKLPNAGSIEGKDKKSEIIIVEKGKEKEKLWKALSDQKSKFNLGLLDGIRDSLSGIVKGMQWEEEDDIEDTDDKFYERVGTFKIGNHDMLVSLKMENIDDGEYTGCKVTFGRRWYDSCVFLKFCDRNLLIEKVGEIESAFSKGFEQLKALVETKKFGEIKFLKRSKGFSVSPKKDVNVKVLGDGRFSDDGYRIDLIRFFPATNKYMVYYECDDGPAKKFYEDNHISPCFSFDYMSEEKNVFFGELLSKLEEPKDSVNEKVSCCDPVGT